MFERFTNSLSKKIVLALLTSECIILLLLVIGARYYLYPHVESQAITESEQRADNFSKLMNNQIDQYLDYSQLIINTASVKNAILEYKKDPTKQNEARLSLALTEQFADTSSLIRGVIIEDTAGNSFHSVANLRDEDYAQLDTESYSNVKEGKSTYCFSNIYHVNVTTNSEYIAYSRNYYINSGRYVLTLFMDCSELVSILESGIDDFSGIAIVDESGNYVYRCGNYIPLEHSIYNTTKTDDGYYFFRISTSCPWQFLCFIEKDQMTEGYQTFLTTVIIFILFLCLLTILIAMLATTRIIKPIHTLNQTMQEASEGNLSVVASEKEKDEIGQLGKVFNQMLRNLNEYIDLQIANESREQKMSYNLLLSQIDSHFIGNTMSAVNSLARAGKTQEIITLNSALLRIIQNNLRIKAIDVTDTIAQEMEMVEQYWLISKIRSNNQAILTWDVPDELLEENIPKNIIQPLVENCLFHGLVNEETGEIIGNINISISDDEVAIYIKVQDDGKGIPPLMVEYLNSIEGLPEDLKERGKHIGLANIRSRLQYLYHENCMTISNQDGACVVLKIPK